ncbi:MAG: 3-deoxy-7-phosphoheptulonate synthase [Planctomycetes bacterium]|nr:3-deoxy-7-phosphoheptulonate synthase [Planctomycetota bacterium]
MIVVMRLGATAKEVGQVIKTIEEMGFKPHLSKGEERTVIGVIGNERKFDPGRLEVLPGVEKVIPILRPFKLASREFHPDDTIVNVCGVQIGGREAVVMAGPCAVEDREQLFEAAEAVKRHGARLLRGGAFKPRTSPYAFQGLGRKGLELLREARERTGLPVVTECLAVQDLPAIVEFADVIQIGARNMQNFNLLEEVGRVQKPVLLKRGMMSTLEELLMSAEYILSKGNMNVILCERGIRTFEKYTRNTLDVSAVPVLKRLSHLPVVVDPSHAAGEKYLVGTLARAGIAAGADGIIVEVHPHPEHALCDGAQALLPSDFQKMMEELRLIARAIGREVAPSPDAAAPAAPATATSSPHDLRAEG